MSILCDFQINTAIAVGNLKIEPFNQENVQPNSYDVSLGDTIISDGVKHQLPYTLKHGEFILATTKERVEIRKCICAQVDGKSTTARKGVMVHLTAGFIDCGFRGNITLEMVNFGKDFTLTEGMKIGQLIFFESQTPFKPYEGHYQDQVGVTPAWDEEEHVAWMRKNREYILSNIRLRNTPETKIEKDRDNISTKDEQSIKEDTKSSQNSSMKKRGRKSTKI